VRTGGKEKEGEARTQRTCSITANRIEIGTIGTCEART